MTGLLRSEYRKLYTVRTTYWLLAGLVGFQLVTVLSAPESASEASDPLHRHTFFFIGAFVGRLFVLVLAIRAITDEFRFGTIVPSLLASPDRRRLIVAKAITLGIAGLVFTAVGEAALLVAAHFKLQPAGLGPALTADAVTSLLGTVLAGALWALVGVGIGALIKHQLVAVVGSIVWLVSPLEDAIRSRLPDLAEYLPGQAGIALAVPPDERALWSAALRLAAWAVAVLLAGQILMMRRDVV